MDSDSPRADNESAFESMVIFYNAEQSKYYIDSVSCLPSPQP